MHGGGAFSRVLTLLAAFVSLPAVQAVSTFGSEGELAAEVAAGVRTGVVEWMTVGNDSFPVIVGEAEREKATGVLLIVPAPGAHADWPDVVRPLRVGLPKQGWQTVAVQMPRAAANGDFVDPARADARIGFVLEGLIAGGVERIVVLAQGLAYRAVVAHLAEMLASSPTRLHGLVLVSPSLPLATAVGETKDPMVATNAPLLEVRGGEDRIEVRELLEEHALSADRGALRLRREVVIDGAGRDYRGQSDLLVRRVRSWLSQLPEPVNPDQ